MEPKPYHLVYALYVNMYVKSLSSQSYREGTGKSQFLKKIRYQLFFTEEKFDIELKSLKKLVQPNDPVFNADIKNTPYSTI